MELDREQAQEAVVSSSKSEVDMRHSPEIIVRDGQPRAVILDIDDYQEMLERLEDLDDLEALKEMKEKPLRFRRLDEFLEEYHPSA
jgi:PHD/YefM family antitoxin component YafN of YafNO toxin-antitoxin module